MNAIDELINGLMKEMVKDAQAKIEIKVDGSKVHCSSESNTFGTILAIDSMIGRIAEDKKLSYKTILGILETLHDTSISLTGESEEQLEVMKTILKEWWKNRYLI